MANYSLEETLQGEPGKNTFSLEEVTGKPKKEAMPAHLRFLYGFHEPFNAAAQYVYNKMPEGVQQAGDAADDWLYDKTGGMLGSEPGSFNKNIADAERRYKAPEGVDWARMGGNFIPALAATKGIPNPTSFGGALATNAGVGAGMGTLNPVYDENANFNEEKNKQALMGGMFGAGSTPISHALGRLIAPKAASNPDIKALVDGGTTPTIGQTLGGMAGRIEEKLTSIPIMGDMINKTRSNVLQDYNKTVINRVLEPIKKKVTATGHDGIKQASQAVSKAYDDALDGLKGVTLDSAAKGEISSLRHLASGLPKDQVRQFNKYVTDSIEARLSPIGGMEARTFKNIESELRQKATRYGKSPVAAEQELGNAFEELLQIMRTTASRQNPQYAGDLAKANSAYARLVRLQNAGKKAATAEESGVFTPLQLMAAVREGDQSIRKNAVGRGDALMQDIAGAGSRVLGNRVPNSFTTDRALLSGGVAGASGFLEPGLLAMLLSGGAAYTRPVQNALVSAATKRPKSAKQISDVIRHSTPALALPGIGLLQSGN